MRQAGIIADQDQAQLFADYLLAQGITNKVDPAEQGWAIWVHDETHLEQARRELAEFLADPQAQRYLSARTKAEAVRREQADAQRRYDRNLINVRQRWRPWNEGTFPLTWVFIVLTVGLSLMTDFGHSPAANKWLYITRWEVTPDGEHIRYQPQLPEIRAGEVWRLFTPAFLQVGGWWHMIGNVYWLYMFGALIETRRGSLILLGVVLVTGILSNLAQYYWKGPSFGGMSGVGFGLFGYVWIKSRFDPRAGIFCPPDLVIFFLIWLVFCMTGWIGPIANAAHVGGMVVGMALAFIPVLWRKYA